MRSEPHVNRGCCLTFDTYTEAVCTEKNAAIELNCISDKMKLLLCFVVACALYVTAQAKESPPKVQVYSYSPGEFGKENVLICHVNSFHPPDISIELLKNGVEIPGAKQTDLAFEQGWKFHLTKSVSFTPQKNEEYSCSIRHMQKQPQKYVWEPDM